jgi:hypothetical protein
MCGIITDGDSVLLNGLLAARIVFMTLSRAEAKIYKQQRPLLCSHS